MNTDVRNLFIFDDEEPKEEIVSVQLNAEPKRIKTQRTVVQRSKEDYNQFITNVYTETHTHPESGEKYEVRVTVLKPEVNPMEMRKPAYAYSSNH